MADIRRQVIAVDDENGPATKKTPDEVSQLEDGYNWKSEGTILPRLSQITQHLCVFQKLFL